ncbi:MAG: phosphopantetheine-binding protein [Desulfobulbaceae bacterium A2]|nr:MAG: phosphopantetheine-binding protein [Desulfobulbaceae bacterium A2]
MTTFEQVRDLIVKVKRGRLKPEAVTPAARLREDLQLDSLAQSELLVLTEEKFAISVSPEDAQHAQTVAQMVATIDAKRAA